MGLDMYLEGRVSAYKTYGDETPSKEREVLVEAAEKLGLPRSDNIDFVTITREVAYWRKANQIHKWFVANVQDGKDDCGDYHVEREQLKTLRDLCARVADETALVEGKVTNGFSYGADGKKEPILESGKIVKNPALAKELLPTESGFFFGSTDYDEYYVADLTSTVAQLDRCLAMPENVEFYYRSSW